jgi:hypothetical protein
MFFASYYTPNCLCILHIISMSTCITHFIHSKQVLLSIKFLPLHFLILDNFFSCQLHFYLNINNCPPMLGILQTRSVLSPFLCLPCCPSAASCWLRRNGVALRESPTCEFFRSQSGDGFFVCCLFFYREVFRSSLSSAFALCTFSTFIMHAWALMVSSVM